MRIIFLLAFTLAGAIAHAQDSLPKAGTQTKPAAPTWEIDVRWAPWLGCWRSEDDLTGTGLRVCITPESVAGVKMLTLVDEDLRMTETVIPDKVARPIADKECRGTSQSEWSRSNQRLFRFTDVTCGSESPRRLSGVSFLLDGPILVDVQFANLTDNKSVRVRRFHQSGNQKLADGSFAPRSTVARGSAVGAPWTVDDVIEAHSKIPSDAVQAAISEAGAGFKLDKRALLAMEKAEVPGNVIDLMIALSYPKKFVVERAVASSVDDGSGGSPIGWWDPFLSPMIPFAMMGSDCFSYYYAYGPAYGCGRFYSAYGYGWGYPSYYPYYSYGYPGWIDVGNGSSIAPPPTEPSAEGRVVNGRGYTQIRNREPIPVPVTGRSGSSGDSSSGGSGNSGTSSTGSSGVSSGGYSGGGSSGGDSGRTAIPRPPGGGL
jgi:uncharacterized membrane protein YgcG